AEPFFQPKRIQVSLDMGGIVHALETQTAGPPCPGANRENLAQLFLDAGSLPGQFAQVVQLGLAHITTALDLNAVNQRAVSLEGTLNTHSVRDLAHGESRVQTTVALADDHDFKRLQ